MTDFQITIFHNPSCGTSRNTLAMIESAGYQPKVVRYLDVGWTPETLEQLLAEGGLKPRDVLRVKGTPAEDLALTDPRVSDQALIQAMVEHPILVERPIVKSPRGVALCRPSEKVLDLLDRQPDAFTKEDGEVVIPKG